MTGGEAMAADKTQGSAERVEGSPSFGTHMPRGLQSVTTVETVQSHRWHSAAPGHVQPE
jgi:hypothetical protein